MNRVTSDIEFLMPAGLNSLKSIGKMERYKGTKYQESVVQTHKKVAEALEQNVDKKKQTKLYEESCDIVQRHKERNNILERIQRSKKEVVKKGKIHFRGNLASLCAPIEFNTDKRIKYPVDKYIKEDVIKQYATMINIIENQIIPKGIDGYERKRLKYINRLLDIFCEDPIVFDITSIQDLPKDGKWYE